MSEATLPLSWLVPSTIELPSGRTSLKVTLPVGFAGPPPFTRADSVTDSPYSER